MPFCLAVCIYICVCVCALSIWEQRQQLTILHYVYVCLRTGERGFSTAACGSHLAFTARNDVI